jgi:type II secretory pathway pseudopilin PulG
MKTFLSMMAMAALLAVPAAAQERSAAQNNDAQVNWSALRTQIDLVSNQNKALAGTIDAMRICEMKKMMWVPGDASGDSDKCVIAKSKAALSCRVVVGTGSSPSYVSTAMCNADEFVTGGGGIANQSATPICTTAPGRSGFLHNNTPNGNGWAIDAYSYNMNGDVCTRAYAVCCKVVN